MIPIRNIYYLLSYSWDLLEEAEELAVETEDLPQVADLLARLIINSTRRLLRRGIDRDYLPQTDVLSTLRGRINFGASIRKLLLAQGKAQCDFEEFLPDLLHNQILKTTIQVLVGIDSLDDRQRIDLNTLLRRMDGIRYLQLRKIHFTEVRLNLNRNNSHYRLLLRICELVYDNILMNEESGINTFRDFLRDKRQMAHLFESFVANFYRKETDWDVTPQKKIAWYTSTPCYLLPDMNADAVLRRKRFTTVVECKYYEETMQSGRYSEKSKIRSQHLYQLLAYVENIRFRLEVDGELEGILIYPTVNICLQEDLVLAGNKIKIRTLNLNSPWEEIAEKLKEFINQPQHQASPS